MLPSFSLDVIDPCNRTGKISVPLKYIFETRGVIDHQCNPHKRDVKDLSLCLLFMRGRCNAGNRCHQCHVDPEFVEKLRAEAAAARNCCAAHGDIHSSGYSQVAQEIHVVDASGCHQCFAAADFARTGVLDTFLRRVCASGAGSAAGGVVTIPAGKICRLHSEGRCKFGKDCARIHLCPSAVPRTPVLRPATPPPKLAPVAIGMGSALRDSCGLSAGSVSSASSSADSSPLERTMAPLNYGDLSGFGEGSSLLDDSGFSLFSQPLRSLKASSPQFDASGFEKELSLVQQDLCESVRLTSPTALKW